MQVHECHDERAWDDFLSRQRYRPFLQSWTMGDVYEAVGQKAVRLEVRDGERIIGICFGHVVPARRGKHLAIPYGPILDEKGTRDMGHGTTLMNLLTEELKKVALEHGCSFIRMSPFWPLSHVPCHMSHARPSPLHLLAEHIWYLPLQSPDPWLQSLVPSPHSPVTEESLFMNLRKTTRNLVRRAEKEGVTVEASADPVRDLGLFLKLHDETRKRHSFVPYTNKFFRAQVELFHAKKACTLYIARHQGNVIATSVHMHCFGETSYHHGASTHAFGNVPASYLLQWTAIKDALKRGDRIYNFWGIAPQPPAAELPSAIEKLPIAGKSPLATGNSQLATHKHHPFAGVTTFKTGYGGNLLNLTHCIDVPLKPSYHLTRLIETARKWKRGF